MYQASFSQQKTWTKSRDTYSLEKLHFLHTHNHIILAVTGNGEIMEGVKFSFDYLLSEAGDKIQFTFDDPDYIEGNDFEEDFTSGIIQCQQQCLAR